MPWVWLLSVVVERLHVGDLHAVGQDEGTRALWPQKKGWSDFKWKQLLWMLWCYLLKSSAKTVTLIWHLKQVLQWSVKSRTQIQLMLFVNIKRVYTITVVLSTESGLSYNKWIFQRQWQHRNKIEFVFLLSSKRDATHI